MDKVIKNKRSLEIVVIRSSGNKLFGKMPLFIICYLTKFDDVI